MSRAPVQPWATLQLRLGAGPREVEELASEADRLGAVGTFLADEPGVGGVETRDAGTLGGALRPELWVYTTPEYLPALRGRALQLCAELGLQVDMRDEVHTDDDWRDSWKEFYAPMVLGDGRLLVRPSWIARRDDDPRDEIVLDPGRAFGTGLHETTRLCLDRLCVLASQAPSPGGPARVLDLGCGSGILALGAARLWPHAAVVAVDNDPEATETTDENVDINDLRARIEVVTGELPALAGRTFDLVLANIRADVHVPLAAALVQHVAPGGRVVLSGVLSDERERVAAAYRACGALEIGADDESLAMGDWVALDFAVPDLAGRP